MHARFRHTWRDLIAVTILAGIFMVLMWMGLVNGAKAETPIPANPGTYVVDQTGILSPADKQRVERRLAQYERSRPDKPQFVVLLIKDLPDQGIEQFATQVFRAWGVGQHGLDNGILEVIHPKAGNHADVRMEVGRGLEGAIPDIEASDLNRKVLGPLWVKGQYADGIVALVDAAFAKLDPVGKIPETYVKQVNEAHHGGIGVVGFLLICVGFGGLIVWLVIKAVTSDHPKRPTGPSMKVKLDDDPYLAGRAERLRREREALDAEWDAKVRQGQSRPEKTYSRPVPPTSGSAVQPPRRTGSSAASTVAAGAAGVAAGLAAEEIMNRRRREREEEERQRRRRRDDETSSYGSALSGGSSSSSSSSGSSWGGSSDSSSSSSSSSSDSGYSSGGGDSGGGGSSDSF